MKPTIVIVAFNRPASLQRLLTSISRADYSAKYEIPLIISIDKSDSDEVTDVAKKFVWKYGDKILINRQARLGLKNHVLLCGDLAEEYSSIIMLEDDLFVSPYFYHYAEKALNYYKNDNKIAGVSLYNYRINETAQRPFEPIHDGTDVYFIQLPSSWGQVWDRVQWKEFRIWNDHRKNLIEADDRLPANVISWPKTSWKREFAKYMVANNKYFVYPRISLTTNYGDIGTHGKQQNFNVQVSLLLKKMDHRFCQISDSLAVYDAHMEILADVLSRLNKKLALIDYEVDLYGTKKMEKINKDYVLTSKKCNAFKLSFSSDMRPHETGIINDIQGDNFRLSHVSAVSRKKVSISNRINKMLYDTTLLSTRNILLFAIYVLIKKIKKIIRISK